MGRQGKGVMFVEHVCMCPSPLQVEIWHGGDFLRAERWGILKLNLSDHLNK